jgi:hypothetical protein
MCGVRPAPLLRPPTTLSVRIAISSPRTMPLLRALFASASFPALCRLELAILDWTSPSTYAPLDDGRGGTLARKSIVLPATTHALKSWPGLLHAVAEGLRLLQPWHVPDAWVAQGCNRRRLGLSRKGALGCHRDH